MAIGKALQNQTGQQTLFFKMLLHLGLLDIQMFNSHDLSLFNQQMSLFIMFQEEAPHRLVSKYYQEQTSNAAMLSKMLSFMEYYLPKHL